MTRQDMAKIMAQCETSELDEFLVVPENYDFLTRGLYQNGDDQTDQVWEYVLDNPDGFSRDLLLQCMTIGAEKVYGPKELKVGEFLRLAGTVYHHVCHGWKGLLMDTVLRIKDGEGLDKLVGDAISSMDPAMLCGWLNRCDEYMLRRKVYDIYLRHRGEVKDGDKD